MQLNNFSGGLSLRLSPHLLGQDEAQEYVNIDPTRGTLTPLKKETLVEGIEPTDSAIYYYKDKWVFSPTPTNYVEFLDILFRDRVDDSPQMTIDGKNWYNIGIEAPEQRPEGDLAVTTSANNLYVAYVYRGRATASSYTHSLPQSTGRLRYRGLHNVFVVSVVINTTFTITIPQGSFAYSTLSPIRPLYLVEGDYILLQTAYYNKPLPTSTFPLVLEKFRDIGDRVNLDAASYTVRTLSSYRPIVTGHGVSTFNKNAQPEFIDILVSEDNITFKVVKTLPMSEATKTLKVTYNELATATEVSPKELFGVEYTTTHTDIVGVNSRMSTPNKEAQLVLIFGAYSTSINNNIGNTNTIHLKTTIEGVDTTVLKIDKQSDRPIDLTEEDATNPQYEYVYTYYSQYTGAESAPSPILKKHVNYLAQEIRLKCVPSEDPQVTNIRVYRRGNTIEEWALVVIADNTSDYIIDNKVDTNIYGDPLESHGNILAPNVKYLVNASTSLYGVIDNNVYFSYDAQPTKWSLLNFISFDSTVTGMCATSNGLLVFTLYRTYVVVGKTVDTLSKYLLDGTVGCISNASIQVYQGYSIWYSHIGVCISSGSDITRIGWEKLGENDLIPASDIICSTVYNNVYYLLYKHNDTTRVLVLDNTTRRLVFRHLDILLDSLSFAKDGLYGVKDKKLYQLFTSEENMTMVWKSPNYADNSVNNLKNYKTIYISSEGDAVINIYIDDKEVMTEVPLTKGLNEIKIPQQYRLGYHITFKIVSDYVIKEIEYKTEERQNGR